MKCFIHNSTYLRHEGCKKCDYRCNCGLKFMTVDDLRRHVEDNHPDHIIISADIAINK